MVMSSYGRPVRVREGTDREYDGRFLGFGIDYFVDDGDGLGRNAVAGPVSSAIVEREDGTLENVLFYHIRFLDK